MKNLPVSSKNDGFVLITALIFLLLMTIAGTAMFNSSSITEKVARNHMDYNIAFQAAESALRDAEIRITGYWNYGVSATNNPIPISQLAFSSTCSNGLCNQEATQPVYTLHESDMVVIGACPGGCDGDGHGTGTLSPTTPTVSAQPKYIIEQIPYSLQGTSAQAGQYAYRITSIGYGRMPQTRVMLQEIFIP